MTAVGVVRAHPATGVIPAPHAQLRMRKWAGTQTRFPKLCLAIAPLAICGEWAEAQPKHHPLKRIWVPTFAGMTFAERLCL